MAGRLLAFGVLVLAIGSAACSGDPPPADPATVGEVPVPVAAQPAWRGNLRAVIRTTGTVTPASGAEFIAIAEEPGLIVEIPPAAGDRVARGDILVRFDLPSAAAESTRNQADIARARALLENARITQSRARELAERGIISRRELENADRGVADAQAELSTAQAAGDKSEAAAARAIIRAPFAGVVAQRLHNPGDVVQGIATDPILRLIDPDRLEVTAAVSKADASRVLPGANARVTSVPNPIRLVVASRPSGTVGGAEAMARLTFADGAALPVDTRLDIEIDGEEHVNTVLVPADALVRSGGETAVMMAAGNRAQRRTVTLGLASGDAVEIVAGVAAGELVITRGQAGLIDGAAITAIQTGP